ncbi:unnamed protein product [Chironomus riparius]|uniref:Uncharacterized protein n=1 Tax=Chironomus riparius TaxID=315576 RepID=A0A9N9WUJ4_9DIPT|nr:unnamed protein product [Chironomus riparius]
MNISSGKLLEALTIHGIRHIFTRSGSKFTRIFWSVAVLLSIIGFCFNNYMLYMKLSEKPDINVRIKQKFISKIPFPAITLCTPVVAKNNVISLYNLSKHIRFKPNDPLNLTIQEQNYLASNIQACIPSFSFLTKRHTQNRTSDNIVKLLNESFLMINETLLNCGYKEIYGDCTTLLNRVITDKGFCYTFNLMGFNTIFNDKIISEDFDSYKRLKIPKSLDVFNLLSSEDVDDTLETFKWSLDKGYDKHHEADSVPVKAEKRKTFSVNLVIREPDISNICIMTGRVFSFYIHLPNEIMLPSHQDYIVEFKKKADVLLTAKSYTTNEGMRKFPPRSRGCYFEGEKLLKYFKAYTKAHCEFECMTNYTLKECGCVKFSMPRSPSTPVCTIEKADCYVDAMDKWPDHEKFHDRFEATCGCLKTCNDIKYDVKFEKASAADNVLLLVLDQFIHKKMKASSKLIENISIHGIGYIFVRHASKYTRVFWSLVVLASIGGLLFNNYLLYQKLNEIPDINVRTAQVFSSKIPFPAITVCTPLFAKNHLGHFYNTSALLRGMTKVKLNLPIDEQNYLASNIHACSPDLSMSLKFHVENRTENNIIKLLNESSLTLSEAIINCGFKGFVTDCTFIFNRVLTDRGFCYTFNQQSFNTIFNEEVISEDFHSYKRSNIRKSMYVANPLIKEKLDDTNEVFKWSLDNGYQKDHEDDSVPVTANKGKYFAFNPYLNESDTKNVCMNIGNIFSFYIHLPNEIMLPMHQEHYVEFKKKRDIILAAKSYKVDEGMRKFPPQTRGCYFEGEKKLKYFKTYTKGLCEYECMTNYTFKECGCVKFSMPRTSSTPVCSVDNAECYFYSMFKWPDYKKSKDMYEATCGCLKSCSDVKYEVKYDKISSSENVMLIYNVYNLSQA